MKAKSIMFQGTGSGVGKSIIVAALCRVLWKKGIRVAPFKAQNMALNSFVTADGKEMGRAQVYQAEACCLMPDVRMNPILLKPTGDSRSQVIVMGEPVGHYSARNYYTHHKHHLEVVRAAYDSLSSEYDVIVLEGAGSPAEINLQHTDIVNMNMADYARSPVVIVGDIDRGGVFAWLKGTWDLVQDRHRRLVRGFVINKFRGDISLLEPGIRMFEQMVPVPVVGTLPWFDSIEVDQEDGCFVNSSRAQVPLEEALRICVVHLPRISNFTDFAPLAFEPDVELVFARKPAEASDACCILLPGTKATRSDLEWLDAAGWSEFIRKRHEQGVMVAGICGGYQMLGQEVRDPRGIEGPSGTTSGLGLLPVVTEMEGRKELCQTEAHVLLPPMVPGPVTVKGYEIHMGKTVPVGNFIPLGPGLDTSQGAANDDLGVWGTYFHGIFENDDFRHGFLNYLRRTCGLPALNRQSVWYEYRRQQLDQLAEWLETGVDIELLCRVIGI